MSLSRRHLVTAAAGAALLPAPLRAQGTGTRTGTPPARSDALRVGLLADMSGTYRDIDGPNTVACVQQAVAEFAATNPGIPVEIVVGDHQGKTDVGASLAREWFDRGVDVVADVSNSALAFAISTMAAQKDRIHLNTGGASSEITGRYCNANSIHWRGDTWCVTNAVAGNMLRSGAKSWFFVTADYAFGKSLQEDTTRLVNAAGGRVLGAAAYPFPGTTDFSAFLLQAQASGADVIAFANGGVDLVNCVKQAHEFGTVRRGTRLAALNGFLQDVHALGLGTAQGLQVATTFYWDLNDRTRAFFKRVEPRLLPDSRPSMNHAASYSAVLHYLRTAAAMGVAPAKASGRAAVAQMKRHPAEDDCFGTVTVREDGRALTPAYLFEVKKPAESHGAWDLYKLLATIPADQAFRPLRDGNCPLVRG